VRVQKTAGVKCVTAPLIPCMQTRFLLLFSSRKHTYCIMTQNILQLRDCLIDLKVQRRTLRSRICGVALEIELCAAERSDNPRKWAQRREHSLISLARERHPAVCKRVLVLSLLDRQLLAGRIAETSMHVGVLNLFMHAAKKEDGVESTACN